MKKEIIFIASCGHSGSTILELLLTSNTKCVGIGEAFQLVDPRNRIIDSVEEYRCGCGAKVHECGLWGPVIKKFRNDRHMPPRQKYLTILNAVYERYGPGITIADSSKVARAMDILGEVTEIGIKVVHLVRDVRPYWVSMKTNHIRNREKTLCGLVRRYHVKGLLKYVRGNCVYIYHDWYRTNKNISVKSKQLGLPYFLLSYEDLCLNTEPTLEALVEFVGFHVSLDKMSGEGTHNHNIFGNRLRHDPEKRKKLRYDYRWFDHSGWVLPSICLPHVMHYNRNIRQR